MENKQRVRLESFVLAVITIGYVGLGIETILLGWEGWMIPVIFIAIVALWVIYIPRKHAAEMRTLFFVYALIASFFHGVHRTSQFDVVVVTAIMLTVMSLLDRVYMLNVILIEFVAIIMNQVYMNYSDSMTEIDRVLISRIILHTGAVICIYVFCRLTVKNRLEHQKNRLREEQEANENKEDMEDFLSNISHELRTPVNVVNGMSRLFLKKEGSDEVDAIYAAGLRLSDQIEAIQDYTEIKREELILEEDKYMSMSLIHDVVTDFHQSNEKKNLELIVDLDPRVPSMMKGDIKKLHKIFKHLLSNAIKFTHKGGIYIKIHANTRDYGVNLIIEVTDTGVGMTRKDIALVSRGMYQANKKRNRSTGGIGIGLPIVYGFVHKMMGFVQIESKRGVGTTVRLSIPQQIIDSAPCLSVREGFSGDIMFFTDPGKYRLPVIREFYKSMAINLATGLGVRLFSAKSQEEAGQLMKKLAVSSIFMGQDEYEANKAFFEDLCEQGYTVAVSAFEGFDPGEGSRVKVMPKPLYGIPIVQILNKEDVFESEYDKQKNKLSLAGLTALVVDDEPMNLVVATGLLRDYKMFSDTAESGMEALRKYEKEDYDVIFMDHMMPEMDGVEAMKRLREMGDHLGRTPVIVALTANALSGAREMFMKEGFDGFIAKPIDIAEFERVMRNVLPQVGTSEEGRDA
ncbi:MAG: ATP-binding protein [Eubacterium sp.]|nr:ATP-binding protein [Eubacterium sp.]